MLWNNKSHPFKPSWLLILLKPSIVLLENGTVLVCILTFNASHGHKAMSARTSALKKKKYINKIN